MPPWPGQIAPIAGIVICSAALDCMVDSSSDVRLLSQCTRVTRCISENFMEAEQPTPSADASGSGDSGTTGSVQSLQEASLRHPGTQP